MHPGGAGVRTPYAVLSESVHEVIVTVELVANIAPPNCTNGSTARAAQTKRITPTTNKHRQGALVRPAASGTVKEKVVLQTARTST